MGLTYSYMAKLLCISYYIDLICFLSFLKVRAHTSCNLAEIFGWDVHGKCAHENLIQLSADSQRQLNLTRYNSDGYLHPTDLKVRRDGQVIFQFIVVIIMLYNASYDDNGFH